MQEENDTLHYALTRCVASTLLSYTGHSVTYSIHLREALADKRDIQMYTRMRTHQLTSSSRCAIITPRVM